MEVVVAVSYRFLYVIVTGFLVVAVRPNGVYGTTTSTFHTFFALPMQTSGMDVIGALAVGCESSMNHEARGTVGTPFFSNEKVV